MLLNFSRHVSSRIDYVVMEDLFWKKGSIKTVYDLKGSQRNRLTKETSHQGQKVLLDTNYLSSMVESPIYLNQSANLGRDFSLLCARKRGW